mgnify:CR=1 FL=1
MLSNYISAPFLSTPLENWTGLAPCEALLLSGLVTPPKYTASIPTINDRAYFLTGSR